MNDRARLMVCFKRVFPDLSEPDILRATMKTVAAWDSTALLMLLAAVEKEFKLRLNTEEVNHFTSFTSILILLRSITPKEKAGKAPEQ